MRKGNLVRVSYTGLIKETGEVFDTTSAKKAKEGGIWEKSGKYGSIPILVGAGKVVKGLDKVLLSMKPNQEREVEIQPENGFGKRKRKLIKTLSRSRLKKQGIEPELGKVVRTTQGLARILAVSGGRVKLDFNHPLAGKVLKYKLKIEEKIQGRKERAKGIIEFYLREKPDVELRKNEILIKKKDLGHEVKKKVSQDLIEWIDKLKKVKFVEVWQEKDL